MPASAEIAAPGWLSVDALAVWEHYAADLIAKSVLQSWDVETFGCFCDAAARRRRAAGHLEEEGEVIEAPVFNGHGERTGHRLAKNPWSMVLADADAQVQRYGARFGLTPSDRAQIRVGSSADPYDDLLTGG